MYDTQTYTHTHTHTQTHTHTHTHTHSSGFHSNYINERALPARVARYPRSLRTIFPGP